MSYDIEFLEAGTPQQVVDLGFIFDSTKPLRVNTAFYPKQPDVYRLEYGDWWYYYRQDGTLYLKHPAKRVIGNLVYTFTYVFDEDAIPVERADGKAFDRVINEHWLAGVYGNRLTTLQELSVEFMGYPVTWYHRDGYVTYAATLGEVASTLLDPERIKKYRAYRWLKDRRFIVADPTIVPWKAEGYIVLWDMADKLHVERSVMADTYKRYRNATEAPTIVDEYYQPVVPADKELDFIRWVKEEGLKDWNWSLYDLSEDEAAEVTVTRNGRIEEAVLTYPEGEPRLKRTQWPWLRNLRRHAGMSDITSRERREVCKGMVFEIPEDE